MFDSQTSTHTLPFVPQIYKADIPFAVHAFWVYYVALRSYHVCNAKFLLVRTCCMPVCQRNELQGLGVSTFAPHLVFFKIVWCSCKRRHTRLSGKKGHAIVLKHLRNGLERSLYFNYRCCNGHLPHQRNRHFLSCYIFITIICASFFSPSPQFR